MTDQRQRIYLIDGSSYIYRAYYAIRQLSNSRGMATNAVFGFTNMLLKVVREERPDHLAVVFDAKGPSFRKDIYPQYKANRSAMPEDLQSQIPLIKQVVRAFKMPALELAGYEADDIIATLARRFAERGMEVTVVTGDKDLMQIVNEQVRLLDTMKDQVTGLAEVAQRFGGAPDKVVEVQSLAGDSSDNVPGVPGIGEKTARDLILQFGTLENLLANIDQVSGKKRQENLRQFADQARLSRQLVTLVDDLPLAVDYDNFSLDEPDREALTALFKELEFHKLLQEFSSDERASGEKYRAVLSGAQLDALVDSLKKAARFAFDTETTSLDAVRADLVGLSFAIRPGEGWYIPLGHRYPGAPEQLDRDLVLEKLRPLLADPQLAKVAQNAKYDMLALRRAGVEVAGLSCDTMVASYLATPAAKSHGLDTLAADLLGYRTISYAEVTGTGKNRIGFAEVAVEKATVYATEDADITLRLADKLEPLLLETHQDALFREVELPLVTVLADMEWQGVRIDAGFLKGLSADMEVRLADLEQEIHQMAGRAFNVSSPRQLGEVLFEELKLPRGKKTKTGWSTDVEVLSQLAEEHAIAARVLDFRSLAKLKNTYCDALPRLIHPETGRIHTSFNQAVTATGRLSSSDPNLQNIPIRTEEGRRIREAFVPAEGNVLLAADYSQVELRILAHMADEPALKESFARGEDIHSRTASEIFGVFLEMVTPEMRRQAKTINFGVLYGMSAFGLAKALGIGRAEAQTYIDNYFSRYPKVLEFMEAKKSEAREKLYVTTLLGRRCAVPEITSKNGVMRGYAERNAINYPIQGSAADIIKVAMVRIFRELQQQRLQARMVLQVHDELIFDVPTAEQAAMEKLVRREMEQAASLDVPLLVDLGVGRSWSEAH
ncbi:DNA polymerase I [Syntrophotalea acetylenica]|uniref:DNA polymerase I n=1 Tax=Syntrophotalea acetylenica TaxID=29542 RepID=A0A1L3GED0_SYNAC|nr:DNA polymerase I [Syntrophotalea acetylenica]APG24310.1 DNA polymerase I [Syntrophotalea acetylenica]APG44893.1 DNA polymerase I [Syntrophotalea acetylenica]MDY0262586.1 DNA polymerase I [Syntrophotalea acetylenica]